MSLPTVLCLLPQSPKEYYPHRSLYLQSAHLLQTLQSTLGPAWIPSKHSKKAETISAAKKLEQKLDEILKSDNHKWFQRK